MKIAYIYFLPGTTSIGILNKFKEQAFALESINDNEVDIIVFGIEGESNSNRINYINTLNELGLLKYSFLSIFGKYRVIDKFLEKKNYQYVILRYPGSDITGISFFKKYNTVVELHANIKSELLSKIRFEKNIIRKLIRFIRLISEIIFYKKIIKNAKGIITNGSELAKLNKEIFPGKDIITIYNGINVNRINFHKFKPFDGEVLDIAFLASKADTWHGLDRIIKSLENYSDIKVNLHIIGDISENSFEAVIPHGTIKYYGKLFGKDLDELLIEMNLAFGPMALFRKNLMETSSLKVAEYIARGLPFVIAYKDSALANVDQKNKFYLQFPNDDSLINFDVIRTFAAFVTKNYQNITGYMHEYACKNLEWSNKLVQYKKFIYKINSFNITNNLSK